MSVRENKDQFSKKSIAGVYLSVFQSPLWQAADRHRSSVVVRVRVMADGPKPSALARATSSLKQVRMVEALLIAQVYA